MWFSMKVKTTFSSPCWIGCIQETQNILGCSIISRKFFCLFFFPPSSLTLVVFRTEIPGSEILPIPIKMTFWTSQEAERKPNVITKLLRFHRVVIHQRNWRCCTFLNLNMPSERLLCHVAFIKKEQARRGIFTVGQSHVLYRPLYLCSLDQYWDQCLSKFSLIFPLLLLPHLCCYPGNFTPFACVLPSNGV